jgi:hypothetical protein
MNVPAQNAIVAQLGGMANRRILIMTNVTCAPWMASFRRSATGQYGWPSASSIVQPVVGGYGEIVEHIAGPAQPARAVPSHLVVELVAVNGEQALACESVNHSR